MEIHQVRYFLAVCEQLNFTKAARKCHVTQPSLTRAIQLLEKEFGGFLFHRERSRIQLTELGRVVLPYLAEVWEQTRVAKAAGKGIRIARRRRNSTLAIMCTIAPGLLIQMFTRFRRRPTGHQTGCDRRYGAVDRGATDRRRGRSRDLLPPRPRARSAAELSAAVSRADDDRAGGRTSIVPRRSFIEIKDLAGEPYVQRSACEFNDMVDAIFRRARGRLRHGLPQRPRRLGAGDDRERFRFRIFSEILDRTSRTSWRSRWWILNSGARSVSRQ